MADKLLHSFAESQAALGGVSRTKIYDLVRQGDIELVKIGRRSFITDASLRRYVRQLTVVGGSS